jgi:hypothetical protein
VKRISVRPWAFKKVEKMKSLVKELHEAIQTCQYGLNEVIGEALVEAGMADLVESTPADISARYWLMQALTPLSKNELKSIVDGFLVQLMNDEQCKKMVRFLLVRFPEYYRTELSSLTDPTPDPDEVKDALDKGKRSHNEEKLNKEEAKPTAEPQDLTLMPVE